MELPDAGRRQDHVNMGKSGQAKEALDSRVLGSPGAIHEAYGSRPDIPAP
jgi:hypothetical protein